jgi:hypothetical protein
MIKFKSIGLWIKSYLFEQNNLDCYGNYFDSDINPSNVPARPVRSHGGGCGRTSQLLTSFWTFNQVWKESGRDKSTSLFPELPSRSYYSCSTYDAWKMYKQSCDYKGETVVLVCERVLSVWGMAMLEKPDDRQMPRIWPPLQYSWESTQKQRGTKRDNNQHETQISGSMSHAPSVPKS